MAALKKNLGLADVFAICAGAMFSSGFFLLPGIAAAQTGSSVHLAYGVAALLILPAMLSKAELATAMPRAGGTYYFLDRALGPAAGTVGGLGTWIALVLKTAFALIGMGAYLALLIDLPIKWVAIVLTAAFTLVNLVGAKESGGIQRVLVFLLLSGLGVWLLGALPHVAGTALLGGGDTLGTELLGGWGGFFSTVGLVFVSYAGLTKVASVAEEVRNPGRDIPLGMGLSLAAVTLVYMVGVWVMNAVLSPEAFRSSLTPVMDSGLVVMDFLPAAVATGVIVIAACSAFASTGNAGILASSRYPLAMARDRLLPSFFAEINRFGTPTWGILVTSCATVLFIAFFPIATVAKLAGAFQLLLFGLVCLAVIVMRSSGIDGYRPSFRSPLYPWVQIFGMIVPVWLISEMGAVSVLFTTGIVIAGLLWYLAYGRARTSRRGAIYHVFERLGRDVHRELDTELLGILRERDAEVEVTQLFDTAVDIEVQDDGGAWKLISEVSEALARRTGLDGVDLASTIVKELRFGMTPCVGDVVVAHRRCPEIQDPVLAIGRLRTSLHADNDELLRGAGVPDHVGALVVVVSPGEKLDDHDHYRLLAAILHRLQQEGLQRPVPVPVLRPDQHEALRHQLNALLTWEQNAEETAARVPAAARTGESPPSLRLLDSATASRPLRVADLDGLVDGPQEELGRASLMGMADLQKIMARFELKLVEGRFVVLDLQPGHPAR